jgi:hypothetical protein
MHAILMSSSFKLNQYGALFVQLPNIQCLFSFYGRRRNLFAEDKNMITHDNYNEPNNYIVFSRLPERPKPINAGRLLTHVYRPDS